MKQLAINLDNGTTIEVVEVNGGWTTCRDIEKGFEFKLRNGKIGKYTAPLAEEPKAEPVKAELAKEPDLCPSCSVLIHGDICDNCGHIIESNKLIKADLDHYVKGAGVTNSGRPTVDIDDVVAKALRGDDLEVLYPRVATWLQLMGRETIGRGSKKMEVTEENLRQRYSRLNVGMQRMNLGNILRGALNDLGLTELPTIED
ncbi:hypothetical protein PHAGE_JEFFCO_42 [Acinetobacter phage JeffCo]|nr:hypothetical protein PHAGE_JEFFCO_42 [Acinetobacter phage JeffCo]